MSGLEEALLQAQDLERKGSYEVVIETLDTAITEAGDNPDIAGLLNMRGIAKRMMQDYDGADKDYHLALKAADNPRDRSEAYTNIADILRVAKSMFDQAHSVLSKAELEAPRASIAYAKAKAQRGLVFFAQKKYENALQSGTEAIKVCSKLLQKKPDNMEYKKMYARVGQQKTACLIWMGKTREAMIDQIEYLSIFKEINDVSGIFNSISTMAKIAGESENWSDAITHYKEALDVIGKTGYERALAGVHLGLSEAYTGAKNPDSAKKHYNLFQEYRAGFTEHDTSLYEKTIDKLDSMYN